MDSLIRNYRCKDVELLTVSSSIVLSARDNLTAIGAKRPLWKGSFFPDLETRIDTAFKTYIGADSAADLRNKTKALKKITVPAKEDLSTFKISITADFNGDKARLAGLLTTLGFATFWKAASNDSQEALVELLYTFKTNMTPAVQTEIVAAGTDIHLITTITGYADALKNANVGQEFAKAQRPLTSAAAVGEFNAIYAEINKVCLVCRNMFKNNGALKNNFSFAAVKRRLSGEAAVKKPAPAAVA